MNLSRGSVVLVTLDPTKGHEQKGTRPCVIVTDPEISSDLRYPLIAVVPITRTPGRGALYPELSPGRSGLRATSYALVDQIRSIDKRRVTQVFGQIQPPEIAAIDDGLRLFLGLQ